MDIKIKIRSCPTYWGDSTKVEFLQDGFVEDGFLQLKGVLTAEETDSLKQDCSSLKHRIFPSKILELSGDIRSIFDIHQISKKTVKPLLDKVIGFAEKILDSKVYIHQSHINYKEALVGGEFDWHSDFTFWHWEDGMPLPRALSFVFFLDKHTSENGGLRVVPGSHCWVYQSNWRRKVQDSIAKIKHGRSSTPHLDGIASEEDLQFLTENSKVIEITGEPGDLLIMDANLLHSSLENKSSFSRRTFFLILNSVENQLVAPFSGNPPRPNYLSDRSFTNIN